MNIYHFTIDEEKVDYDCYDAHIVRASSVAKARELCPVADEGQEALDFAEVKIIATKVIGKEEVILSSFNAG